MNDVNPSHHHLAKFFNRETRFVIKDLIIDGDASHSSLIIRVFSADQYGIELVDFCSIV